MKNELLAIAFLLLAVVSVNAQVTTPPTSFKPNGTNSLGVVVASESTDSVTVGAVMDYWVMPSASATATTTWAWSRPTGTATITGVPTGQTATITFPSAAETGSIKAIETTTCSDPTGTTIPYAVIKAPEVGFSDATPTTTIGACNFTAAQTLNVKLTSYIAGTVADDETMNVTYTVSKGGTGITTGAIQSLKRNATTIAIPFTEFGSPTVATAAGTYTVTFTKVDDRILRKATNKATIMGTINTATYTIVVTPVPTTGAIYHLPNL